MIRFMLRLLGPTRLLAALVAALVLISLASQPSHGEALPSDPAITQVRVLDEGTRTRVVLDMAAAPDFRLDLLEDPNRLVLDFPRLRWDAGSGSGQGAGLVAAHRFGALDDQTMRVVFDLAAAAHVRDAFFLPAAGELPYRFVVDLVPPELATAEDTGADDDPIGALIAADGDLAGADLEDLEQLRGIEGDRPVVVIDPGHGGVDPGAIGVTGIFEKTIALTVARQLRDRLVATERYTVVMTRDSDIYVRLEDRVAIARAAGADLFISVHADSIEEAWIRGASVYTLSAEASDRQAAELAARENRADLVAGIDWANRDDALGSIVLDLAQRLSVGHANVFAEQLVDRLSDHTRLLNNTHREAGFVVLKAPDVPSVLVELGYLSNRQDEAELADPAHQTALAEALFAGVEDYFAWRATQGGI
jgi:N-acetylmuramoyl-L-alanine amidase